MRFNLDLLEGYLFGKAYFDCNCVPLQSVVNFQLCFDQRWLNYFYFSHLSVHVANFGVNLEVSHGVKYLLEVLNLSNHL